MSLRILPYDHAYRDQIAALILHIQAVEYSLPITLEKLPDLLSVPDVYLQGAGGFWVAEAGDEVVGTIGLQDIGDSRGEVRRMFVKEAWRGRLHRIAQHLLEKLEAHARERGLTQLFLGTIESTHAAQKLYLRNGYERIRAEELPAGFAQSPVDTVFFRKFL